MPIDLHIIRANEFVCMDARQRLDFQATKNALASLAQACRKRGLDRALIDLRALPIPPKPQFSPSELASLVDTFRESGFDRRQRLAVLYRMDPHHGARVFALISRLRGWRVQAFADFEAALLWLSTDSEERKDPDAEEIPIRIAKRKLEMNSSTAATASGKRSEPSARVKNPSR